MDEAKRIVFAANQGPIAMTFTSVLLTSAILAAQIHPTFGADSTHADYLASVSTYRPMAGFNHVVGPNRFVGYFVQAPGACRVTVFKAFADDESLATPPERIVIDIAAAGRSEFAAADGSALAIACTADADAIKIAPQRRTRVSVTP